MTSRSGGTSQHSPSAPSQRLERPAHKCALGNAPTVSCNVPKAVHDPHLPSHRPSRDLLPQQLLHCSCNAEGPHQRERGAPGGCQTDPTNMSLPSIMRPPAITIRKATADPWQALGTTAEPGRVTLLLGGVEFKAWHHVGMACVISIPCHRLWFRSCRVGTPV